VNPKIAAGFAVSYEIAQRLDQYATWKALLGLSHPNTAAGKQAQAQAKANAKAAAHAQAVANAAAKTATAAKVRAQAIPADVVVPRDLAGLRGQVQDVQRRLDQLWQRVRGLSLPAVGGIAVGALAFALSRLGMPWARCSNVGKVGRNVCGMDANLLQSLLADTLMIAGTLSLVEFAEEMQGVTEAAVRPILSFWRAS
jgi:hypothetical protein